MEGGVLLKGSAPEPRPTELPRPLDPRPLEEPPRPTELPASPSVIEVAMPGRKTFTIRTIFCSAGVVSQEQEVKYIMHML